MNLNSTLSSPSWDPAVPRYHWLSLAVVVAVAMGATIAFGGADASLVCLSLLILVFVLLDFRVGVVLLMALTPISASSLVPHSIGGYTGLNPIYLLLGATLAAAWLRSRHLSRLVPPPLLWLYLVPLILAALIGSGHVQEIAPQLMIERLLSFDDAQGYLRDQLIKPLQPVAVALLIGPAIAKSRKPEYMLLPILVSIVALCLLVIGFVLYSGANLEMLSSPHSREFFLPLGIHANDLGRLCTFAYALLLFVWAGTRTGSRSGGLKLTLGLALALTVAALVCTFSRGAFLGFALVNALFLLSHGKGGSLLLGAAGLAAVALVVPAVIFDRITVGWDDGLNAISAGRVDDIWLPLLPELWRHPLIGNGLGSIAWSDAMRGGHTLLVTHPHSAYLQTLLDMGVLGLAALGSYFTLVWREFRLLSRAAESDPLLRGFFAGASAGLASLLLSGISGGGLAPGLEQSYLWLAIGMMYGCRRRRED